MSENQITELKQFIRRPRNGVKAKVGLLYAQKLGGIIAIGYSLCSKVDEFDIEEAHNKAFDRSISYAENRVPYFVKSVDCSEGLQALRPYTGARNITVLGQVGGTKSVRVVKNTIPDSIKTELALFIGRAERCFKDEKLPEWAAQFYNDHKHCVAAFFAKLERKKEEAKRLAEKKARVAQFGGKIATAEEEQVHGI